MPLPVYISNVMHLHTDDMQLQCVRCKKTCYHRVPITLPAIVLCQQCNAIEYTNYHREEQERNASNKTEA